MLLIIFFIVKPLHGSYKLCGSKKVYTRIFLSPPSTSSINSLEYPRFARVSLRGYSLVKLRR